MAYRLSRKAEDDLTQLLVGGEREFGAAQAELYFRGLERTFLLLSDHPRAARERAEITPPVRIHPYRSHVVIYRTDGDDIVILRVRHGREDWDQTPL